MFRTSNKFDDELFLSRKFNAILAVIEMNTVPAIAEVCTRMQDCEASIGEKILLFEVLGNAANALSNRPIDKKEKASYMTLEEVLL